MFRMLKVDLDRGKLIPLTVCWLDYIYMLIALFDLGLVFQLYKVIQNDCPITKLLLIVNGQWQWDRIYKVVINKVQMSVCCGRAQANICIF